MVDKEQQIKNTLIYLIPIMVSNLFPFLTIPIFTRILTKEDYGVLALAMVYATFANGICNFGLTAAYDRNFFKYKEKRKRAELLYSTLLFVVTLVLIIATLTFFFKSSLSKLIIGSSDFGNLLFWNFCATVLLSVQTYYLKYFRNMEDAKMFVKYTIFQTLFVVVLNFFFIVYLRTGIIGLVWGPLLGNIVVTSLLVRKFLKFLPFAINFRILRESLRLSYPLTPKIFLGVIGNQFDKYMIGLMATMGGVVTLPPKTSPCYKLDFEVKWIHNGGQCNAKKTIYRRTDYQQTERSRGGTVSGIDCGTGL